MRPASRRMLAIVLTMLLLEGLAVVALIVQPARAAVGIGVTGGCSQTATNTNTCTITMSGALTSGRTVLVGISSPGTRTVSTVTGGGSYSQLNNLQNTVRGFLWGTTVGGGTGGTSSIVVTMSGNGRFVAWASEYTGVTFYGPTPYPTNSGSTANPTISYTLHDANDWLVSVLTNSGTAPTAGTGNFRDGRATTGVSQGYVDNTAASATSVTTSDTHAADTWTAVGIELVIASGCTRAPTFTYSSGTQVTFHPTAPLIGAATAADGQGAGTPAVTVTNKGPGPCAIGIKRASAAPAGVEDQWATTNSAPNSGTNDVTTSNVNVCTGVAEAAMCTVYMWSRVTSSSSTPPNSYANTYTFTEA